jgi:putative transcriptional regulator
MDIKNIDIEKEAAAIEADFGEALPDLRQALAEAKAGLGRITTPEQILAHQAQQKSGLIQVEFDEQTKTLVATLRD